VYVLVFLEVFDLDVLAPVNLVHVYESARVIGEHCQPALNHLLRDIGVIREHVALNALRAVLQSSFAVANTPYPDKEKTDVPR